MKKAHKTPLAVTLGTTLLSGLAAVNAHAGSVLNAENPFAIQELSSGYMQTAEAEPAKDAATKPETKKMEGACGEGKCGAKMMQEAKDAKEAGKKPDEAATKAMEGKCAGMKK